jgi:hypothetical protein
MAPEQREYTAPDIVALADKFTTIEVELFKLRRSAVLLNLNRPKANYAAATSRRKP